MWERCIVHLVGNKNIWVTDKYNDNHNDKQESKFKKEKNRNKKAGRVM